MIFSNFTGRVAKKAKVIDGVNGQFLRPFGSKRASSMTFLWT